MRRFFSHWTIVCLSTWLDHITIKLSHKDAIYSCMGIYPPCAMNFKIFQFLIIFWFVELYGDMLNKHLPLHLIGYEDNLNLKGRIYIFFVHEELLFSHKEFQKNSIIYSSLTHWIVLWNIRTIIFAPNMILSKYVDSQRFLMGEYSNSMGDTLTNTWLR